jgi:hypothetical protein
MTKAFGQPLLIAKPFFPACLAAFTASAICASPGSICFGGKN